MKVPLACAAVLALVLGGVFVFGSPEGLGGRVRGYFQPVPSASAEEAPPPREGLSPGTGTSAAGSAPAWRAGDREGFLALEGGDFEAAAARWDEASAKAPPAEAASLRGRADRARLYGLLVAGVPIEAGPPGADEAEYRRRLDSLSVEDAGAWLDLAHFAASRGLRHHLGFLLEEAYGRRQGRGREALSKRATDAIRRTRAAGAAAAPEVLESVIRELPSSEAAELARSETGAGIGGVVKRGAESGGGADIGRLNEARDLAAKGDAEYRLAVPGSKDVNIHRRRALDLYEKSRAIYQDVDDNRGTYGTRIRELNRNIAELHKDLPLGK